MEEYSHIENIRSLNREWLNSIKSAIDANDLVAFVELGGIPTPESMYFFSTLDDIDIENMVAYTHRILLNISPELTLIRMLKSHIQKDRNLYGINGINLLGGSS